MQKNYALITSIEFPNGPLVDERVSIRRCWRMMDYEVYIGGGVYAKRDDEGRVVLRHVRREIVDAMTGATRPRQHEIVLDRHQLKNLNLIEEAWRKEHG